MFIGFYHLCLVHLGKLLKPRRIINALIEKCNNSSSLGYQSPFSTNKTLFQSGKNSTIPPNLDPEFLLLDNRNTRGTLRNSRVGITK